MEYINWFKHSLITMMFPSKKHLQNLIYAEKLRFDWFTPSGNETRQWEPHSRSGYHPCMDINGESLLPDWIGNRNCVCVCIYAHAAHAG